jgi:hypothetical protein
MGGSGLRRTTFLAFDMGFSIVFARSTSVAFLLLVYYTLDGSAWRLSACGVCNEIRHMMMNGSRCMIDEYYFTAS